MSGVNYLKTFGGRIGANVGPSPTCTYIEGGRPYTIDSYCGAPSVRGKSWCGDHLHKCFRIIDTRLQRDFERGVLATSTRAK